MPWNPQKIASFLLTAAITSLLCIGLYHFNNKYTHNQLQPEHGHLTISAEQLDTCHYLIDDWCFYPDVMLTPEDLHTQQPAPNGIYTRIGERTRFDGLGTRNNPHGCGTYAIWLHLPEDVDTYALELPEIFSAYRLYINGEEYLQLGNPDPENYEARTQAKLITFRAAGQAEILISACDHSHFYSGMVYPPVFGSPTTVMQFRDIRQSITLLTISLSLILLISTLYLGIIMKRTNALLFAFLCLSMSLTIFFPFLHTLLELPVYPWYMLELVCIYLMPLLVIILHNRICDVPPRLRWISIGIGSLVCLIACGYGMNAHSLTVPIMRTFSNLVFLYKLGVAMYLLITAYVAVNAGIEQVRPLYYASIAYALMFLWDRILPVFEPIYYGWFMDWANLIVVTAIGFSLMHDMVSAYFRNLAFAEEHRQMTRQLAMQSEYSRQLAEQSEKNRRLIHDFRHHLRTIASLLNHMEPENENITIYNELCAYLNQVSDNTVSLTGDVLKPFSDNASVDALLQYYYSYARQQSIDTEFRLVNADLKLTDVEYCTLLGNLLENAIDACMRLPKNADRQIHLSSKETEHLLFIRIENTYDGMIIKTDTHFYSRKTGKSSHGIGMESVREIVERYGGSLDVYPLSDRFRVGILLPIKHK